MPTVQSLRASLEQLGYSSSGNKDALRQRLRKARKSPISSPADQYGHLPSGQSEERSWVPTIHTFLVTDIEATCIRERRPPPDIRGGKVKKTLPGYDYPNEIIEFPVVVLHWNPVAREYEETGRFHRFVRPLWRPQLILWELFNWLNAEGLLEQRSRHDPPDKYRLAEGVCWVTHGPEDLSGFVPKQSWIAAQSLVFAFPGFGMRASRGLPPLWLRGPLLDIRKAFCLLTRLSGKDGGLTADAAHGRHLRRDVTIAGILRQLGMEFEGRQHSGICDAHNLARILVEMARCVRDGISSERSIPEAHTGDQDGSVDVSALATALDGTHLVPSSQLPENSELTSSDVSLYTPAPDLQPDVSRTPRLYIPPKEGEVILKPNISHSSFGNTPYWWMVRPGQVDWPHPPEL